jgi:hypothetical protein
MRIATDDCAIRLEIFRAMLQDLCRECGFTLNIYDIDGRIAVRDVKAPVDSDWPAVATFTSVNAPFGVTEWEICTREE